MSALPITTKITTLSQEGLRRMRNTSRSQGTQVIIEILNLFMIKMLNSGYPEDIRYEVLKSCVKGYYRMVLSEVCGTRRVNESSKVGKESRDIKNTVGNRNWYKPKYIETNEVM